MTTPPTTRPLLTISAFARAVDLAPSTLRYYDECGLLPPTEVDARTGYRYYTPDLARRAHLVRRMREMGVPVETMRAVLDGSAEDAVRLLRGYADRAAASARQVAEALDDVAATLRTGSSAGPGSGDTREEEPVTVTLDGPQLGVALGRVATAAAPDPGSPLGGVLLDATRDAVTVVATDRYWMAAWTLPPTGATRCSGRAVLAADAVKELAGRLARTDTVLLELTGGALRLTAETGPVDVPTVADRFPAWRMVLDAQPEPAGRVSVERARLLAALERAVGPVRLVVGDDRLRVAGHGEVEGVHLDAVTVGDRATLGFSPVLLGAALRAAVGDTVTLEHAGSDRAVRVTSPEQRAFVALVMPIGPEA